MAPGKDGSTPMGVQWFRVHHLVSSWPLVWVGSGEKHRGVDLGERHSVLTLEPPPITPRKVLDHLYSTGPFSSYKGT